MIKFKFTAKAIADLPPAPPGRRIEYADEDMPAFRLRVGPVSDRGVVSKSYSVALNIDGKFVRRTIGAVQNISLTLARRIALEQAGQITATRKNPNIAEREQQIVEITLHQALTAYIASRADRLRPTTKNQYQRLLVNYSDDWMRKNLSTISRDMILYRHQEITQRRIWLGGTRVNGKPIGGQAQANLWARIIRAIYRHARESLRGDAGEPLLPESPVGVLSAQRKWNTIERKSTRIRQHDLARWYEASEAVRSAAELVEDGHTVACVDALQMMLFTGLRRSEVLGLTWSRVNLDGQFFWIATTKNGHPHELPITGFLMEIFQRRLAAKAIYGDAVFSVTGESIVELRRAMDLIADASVGGLHAGKKPLQIGCHDLRRTFATQAELCGIGTYVLKRLLNHRSGGGDVTAGYVILGADELKGPAAIVERSLLELCGITEPVGSMDAKLSALIGTLSDQEKRRLLFSLANPAGEKTPTSNDQEQTNKSRVIGVDG